MQNIKYTSKQQNVLDSRTIRNSQNLETMQMPSNSRIDKLWYIHTKKIFLRYHWYTIFFLIGYH